MSGENLDLSSEAQSPQKLASRERKFIGITFACCAVYSRVYINRDGTAYEGSCPKCSRCLRLGIDPQGSDSRFFTAY